MYCSDYHLKTKRQLALEGRKAIRELNVLLNRVQALVLELAETDMNTLRYCEIKRELEDIFFKRREELTRIATELLKLPQDQSDIPSNTGKEIK